MVTSNPAPEHERVLSLLQKWTAAGLNAWSAKEPPFDPEDGGVPPAMWDGEPNAEGWVRWRAVDSTVGERDLVSLEARIGRALPPLLRAWLSARCMGPLEGCGARLPPLWSDAPLGELMTRIEAWAPLVRAGYLPVADDENDAGPLCLDLAGGADPAVVLFDHERLSGLNPERWSERSVVEPLCELRWTSFGALLDAFERIADESLAGTP